MLIVYTEIRGKNWNVMITLKGTVKLQTDPWAIVAVEMMLKIIPQILDDEI